MSRRKAALWVIVPLLVIITGVATGLYIFPSVLCGIASSLIDRCAAAPPDNAHSAVLKVEEATIAPDHGAGPAAEQQSVTSYKSHDLAAPADYREPDSRKSKIVQAAREVVFQQSAMAHGHDNSSERLRLSMVALTARLNEVELPVLGKAEVEACAMHVLSGGNPSSASHCLKSSALSVTQRELLEGVEAFANADMKKAFALLGTRDAAEFEMMLGAQLSMAQASLMPDSENEKAIRNLMLAADAVPGTLVEEAAIRRLIVRLAEAGHPEKFFYWSNRYVRRFSRSLYYTDFERAFVASLATIPDQGIEAGRDSLTSVFRLLGELRSSALARAILMRAIREGKTGLCSVTASAFEGAKKGSVASHENMSTLVKVCTAVVGDAVQRAGLKAISHATLEGEVGRLLQNAITLARIIDSDGASGLVDLIGPSQPLSVDPAYADLVASVAQQLDASIKASNRVSDNEPDPKDKP